MSHTLIVHLSTNVESLPQGGEPEEPCDEFGEDLLMGNNWSSYDANGNSAILSIRGELTEIFGEVTWQSKPVLDLQGGS